MPIPFRFIGEERLVRAKGGKGWNITNDKTSHNIEENDNTISNKSFANVYFVFYFVQESKQESVREKWEPHHSCVCNSKREEPYAADTLDRVLYSSQCCISTLYSEEICSPVVFPVLGFPRKSLCTSVYLVFLAFLWFVFQRVVRLLWSIPHRFLNR